MFPKPAHTRADELKHILRIKRKRPAPGHYGLRAQDLSRLEAPGHQNSPETNRKSSDFRREPTCSRTQDWQRCNISNITLHGGLEATTSSNVDISRKCAHDKTSTGMRCASENRRHLEKKPRPRPLRRKQNSALAPFPCTIKAFEDSAADAAIETWAKSREGEGLQHKGGAYRQRLLGIAGASVASAGGARTSSATQGQAA